MILAHHDAMKYATPCLAPSCWLAGREGSGQIRGEKWNRKKGLRRAEGMEICREQEIKWKMQLKQQRGNVKYGENIAVTNKKNGIQDTQDKTRLHIYFFTKN